MEIIVNRMSTNGRWGLCVVAPEGTDPKAPIEGSLGSLGEVAGVETYQITPGGTGQWFLLEEEDIEVLAGATVVVSMSLQSGDHAAIVALGPFAAIRRYGYKRRSSHIVAFRRGEKIEMPPALLAAMGLIPCDRKEVKIETPALPSALEDALKCAGIAVGL